MNQEAPLRAVFWDAKNKKLIDYTGPLVWGAVRKVGLLRMRCVDLDAPSSHPEERYGIFKGHWQWVPKEEFSKEHLLSLMLRDIQ